MVEIKTANQDRDWMIYQKYQKYKIYQIYQMIY